MEVEVKHVACTERAGTKKTANEPEVYAERVTCPHTSGLSAVFFFPGPPYARDALQLDLRDFPAPARLLACSGA